MTRHPRRVIRETVTEAELIDRIRAAGDVRVRVRVGKGRRYVVTREAADLPADLPPTLPAAPPASGAPGETTLDTTPGGCTINRD